MVNDDSLTPNKQIREIVKMNGGNNFAGIFLTVVSILIWWHFSELIQPSWKYFDRDLIESVIPVTTTFIITEFL